MMVAPKAPLIQAITKGYLRGRLTPYTAGSVIPNRPVNAADPVMAGAHLFAEGAAQDTANDQGWITSACYSPHVGSAIGLGYLVNGDSRKGEVVVAANPLQGQSVRLRVVSAHFVDPEGGRVRD